MKRAARVAGLGLVLGLAHAAWAAPPVCTEAAVCRVGAIGKTARALAATPGGLWAVGAKGVAWRGTGPEAESFAAPVKTGAKRDLLAAAPLGQGLVAVGQAGTIVRMNGTLWTVDKSPAKKDLLAVWAASERSAWAVGKAGTILHWDGAAWQAEASGVKVDLHGVWGVREGDVWAVGDKATILHHDGTGWSSLHSGTTRLDAVGGTATNDVWAVGEVGTVLHWDGASWAAQQSGTAGELTVVAALGPDDVLIMGAEGNGVRRWRGSLNAVVAGEDGFRAGALMSSAAYFLADSGDLWRYTGGWRELPSPATGAVNLTSAAVHGETVAVGGEDGALALRQGGVWKALPPVKMSTVLSLVYDGDTLVALDSFGVARIDAKGAGVYKKLPVDKGDFYDGIWFGGGSGFAVGNYGLLARWNGKLWTKQASGVKVDLRAVAGAAADKVWAVGSEGTIVMWDGKVWTKQDSGTTDDLWVLWVGGPDFAVAAGSSGVVTVWNGTGWHKADTPPTTLVRSVCGRSPTDFVVGGNDGEIVRFDGTRWAPEGSPIGAALIGCAMTPSGDTVFTVQNNGLVVRQGLK